MKKQWGDIIWSVELLCWSANDPVGVRAKTVAMLKLWPTTLPLRSVCVANDRMLAKWVITQDSGQDK